MQLRQPHNPNICLSARRVKDILITFDSRMQGLEIFSRFLPSSCISRRSIKSHPKVTPVWLNAGFVARWEHLRVAVINKKRSDAETKHRKENRALKQRGNRDRESPAGSFSFVCVAFVLFSVGSHFTGKHV